MEITVRFAGKMKKLRLEGSATVEQALLKAKINPQVVIVKKRKEIIPDNEKLEDGDVIEALKIVSGG